MSDMQVFKPTMYSMYKYFILDFFPIVLGIAILCYALLFGGHWLFLAMGICTIIFGIRQVYTSILVKSIKITITPKSIARTSSLGNVEFHWEDITNIWLKEKRFDPFQPFLVKRMLVIKAVDGNLMVLHLSTLKNLDQKRLISEIREKAKCSIVNENASAWNNKGVTLNKSGRWKEAIACFDKALKIDPNYTRALTNKLVTRGIVLSESGLNEKAIKHFDEALEIDSNSVFALNEKGLVFDKMDKHQKAIGYFDKALKIDDKDINALNNKGNALGRLGMHEEAIKYFDRVLNINPNDTDALYNKGIDLKKIGRYKEAKKCFQKVKYLERCQGRK